MSFVHIIINQMTLVAASPPSPSSSNSYILDLLDELVDEPFQSRLISTSSVTSPLQSDADNNNSSPVNRLLVSIAPIGGCLIAICDKMSRLVYIYSSLDVNKEIAKSPLPLGTVPLSLQWIVTTTSTANHSKEEGNECSTVREWTLLLISVNGSVWSITVSPSSSIFEFTPCNILPLRNNNSDAFTCLASWNECCCDEQVGGGFLALNHNSNKQNTLECFTYMDDIYFDPSSSNNHPAAGQEEGGEALQCCCCSVDCCHYQLLSHKMNQIKSIDATATALFHQTFTFEFSSSSTLTDNNIAMFSVIPCTHMSSSLLLVLSILEHNDNNTPNSLF